MTKIQHKILIAGLALLFLFTSNNLAWATTPADWENDTVDDQEQIITEEIIETEEADDGDSVIEVESNVSDSEELVEVEDEFRMRARKLRTERLDNLLSDLKQVRNQLRERENINRHLSKLKERMEAVSAETEEALNNFITYGADENTQSLGEGERAAVLYSYKDAFKKLPESEEELSDAIRIANGRWPAIRNQEAEKRAKFIFKNIYRRLANMNNAKDNAAVTVMAYGLRQKAENRKLETEQKALEIYKNIFGDLPNSTEDWNALQAIAYSGATRQTDTDGDYISDEYELELGTDPAKADSDGDGYSDGTEVENDFDPVK